MAAADPAKKKEPVNIVHQNAQFCETVMKERKTQKIFEGYSINPYKKCKENVRNAL